MIGPSDRVPRGCVKCGDEGIVGERVANEGEQSWCVTGTTSRVLHRPAKWGPQRGWRAACGVTLRPPVHAPVGYPGPGVVVRSLM